MHNQPPHGSLQDTAASGRGGAAAGFPRVEPRPQMTPPPTAKEMADKICIPSHDVLLLLLLLLDDGQRHGSADGDGGHERIGARSLQVRHHSAIEVGPQQFRQAAGGTSDRLVVHVPLGR